MSICSSEVRDKNGFIDSEALEEEGEEEAENEEEEEDEEDNEEEEEEGNTGLVMEKVEKEKQEESEGDEDSDENIEEEFVGEGEEEELKEGLEKRSELHLKWLNQQEDAMEEDLFNKIRKGWKSGKAKRKIPSLLAEEDDEDDIRSKFDIPESEGQKVGIEGPITEEKGGGENVKEEDSEAETIDEEEEHEGEDEEKEEDEEEFKKKFLEESVRF